jgi:hypothetical protein
MLKRRTSTSSTSKRRAAADRKLAAAMLALLRDGADLRRRKSRRLRGAIRARIYENDLKFQIAIDKMVKDLVG